MPLDGRGASGWGGKDWEWGASGAATVLNEDMMTARTGCWLGGEIQVVGLCILSGDRDSIKMRFFVVVVIVVILFFGRVARHVESWFPNQGSNLYPLHWKKSLLKH